MEVKDESGIPAKGVRLQGFKGFKLNRTQVLLKPSLNNNVLAGDKKKSLPSSITSVTKLNPLTTKITSNHKDNTILPEHNSTVNSALQEQQKGFDERTYSLGSSTDKPSIVTTYHNLPKKTSELLVTNPQVEERRKSSSSKGKEHQKKLKELPSDYKASHKRASPQPQTHKQKDTSRSNRHREMSHDRSPPQSRKKHHSGSRERKRSRSLERRHGDSRSIERYHPRSTNKRRSRSRERHRPDYHSPKKSKPRTNNAQHGRTSLHPKQNESASSSSVDDDDDEMMRRVRERRRQRSKSPETYSTKKRMRRSSESKSPIRNSTLSPDSSHQPHQKNPIAVIGKVASPRHDKLSKETKEKKSISPKGKVETKSKPSNSVVPLASIGCWLGDDEDLEYEVVNDDANKQENITTKHDGASGDEVEDTLMNATDERNVFESMMHPEDRSSQTSKESDEQPSIVDEQSAESSIKRNDDVEHENTIDELSEKLTEKSESLDESSLSNDLLNGPTSQTHDHSTPVDDTNDIAKTETLMTNACNKGNRIAVEETGLCLQSASNELEANDTHMQRDSAKSDDSASKEEPSESVYMIANDAIYTDRCSLFEKLQSDLEEKRVSISSTSDDSALESHETVQQNISFAVPFTNCNTCSENVTISTQSVVDDVPDPTTVAPAVAENEQKCTPSTNDIVKPIHPAKKRYHAWFKNCSHDHPSKVLLKPVSETNDIKTSSSVTSATPMDVVESVTEGADEKQKSSPSLFKEKPTKMSFSYSLEGNCDKQQKMDAFSEKSVNETPFKKRPVTDSTSVIDKELVSTADSGVGVAETISTAETLLSDKIASSLTPLDFASETSTPLPPPINLIDEPLTCVAVKGSPESPSVTSEKSKSGLLPVSVDSNNTARTGEISPRKHTVLPGEQSPESPLFQQSPLLEYTLSDDQSSLSGLEDLPPVEIRIPIDNEDSMEKVDYETSEVKSDDAALASAIAEKDEATEQQQVSFASHSELPPSLDDATDSAVDDSQEERRRSARIKKMDKKKPTLALNSLSVAAVTENMQTDDMDVHDKENASAEPIKSMDVITPKSEPLQVNATSNNDAADTKQPPIFERIHENFYLFQKKKSRARKEIRRMLCDCITHADERKQPCGESCLNRLLMIECSARCPYGELCTNKRFQRQDYVRTEVFETSWKGWGLRASEHIPPGKLVMEYCGEVLDPPEFYRRSQQYDQNNQQHFYFMALSQDEIIDATYKGNNSRFINHSCDPNCETQKWTVNGRLRVGFFTVKPVPVGEEITFDYQFENYGKEAQVCYCGSTKCRGYLGKPPRENDRSKYEQGLLPAISETDAERDKRSKQKGHKYQEFKENTLESEISRLNSGLRTTKEVLLLSRLMVRCDTIKERLMCLRVIRKSDNQSCLRSFLQFHGLPLIWSWMVDISGNFAAPESESPCDVARLKAEILATLAVLPITNKNILEESKVLSMVKRWSEEENGANNQVHADDEATATVSKDNQIETSVSDHADGSAENVPQTTSHEEKNADNTDTTDAPAVTMNEENSDIRSQGTENNHEEDTSGSEKLELSHKVINLTSKLLESWKDLKEIYRIPKRQKPVGKLPKGGDSERSAEDSSSPTFTLQSGGMKEERENSPHRGRGSYEREHSRDNERHRHREQDRDRKHRRSPSRNRWKDDDAGKLSKQSSHDRESGKYSWLYASESNSGSTRLSRKEHRRQYERDMRNRDEKKNDIKEAAKKSEPSLWLQPAPTVITTSPQTSLISSAMPTVSTPAPSLVTVTSRPDATTFTPSGYSGNLIQINPSPAVIPQPVLYQTSQTQMQQTLQFQTSQPLIQISTNHLEPQYIFSTEPQGQSISVLGAPTPQQTSLLGNPYSVASQVITTLQLPQTVPMANNGGVTILGYHGGNAIVLLTPNQLKELTDLLAYKSVQQSALQPQMQVPIQIQPPMQIEQQSANLQPTGLQPQPVMEEVAHLQAQAEAEPMQSLGSEEPPTIPQPQSAFDPIPPSSEASDTMSNSGASKSPPRDPRPVRLPPNWKTASDADGCIYYYHVISRQTQWEPPIWDGVSEEDMVGKKGADMEISTPTQDDGVKKTTEKLAATAVIASDTEHAKKCRESFRSKMSQHIVNCLSSYRKSDCKIGRITSTEDFKRLARKLTHNILIKEIKQVQVWEDLECNANVKHKAKEYVRKYMAKMGPVYKSKDDDKMR